MVKYGRPELAIQRPNEYSELLSLSAIDISFQEERQDRGGCEDASPLSDNNDNNARKGPVMRRSFLFSTRDHAAEQQPSSSYCTFIP